MRGQLSPISTPRTRGARLPPPPLPLLPLMTFHAVQECVLTQEETREPSRDSVSGDELGESRPGGLIVLWRIDDGIDLGANDLPVRFLEPLGNVGGIGLHVS